MIVHSDVDDYLHISSSHGVDLDVFLNGPVYFQYPDYELLIGKCFELCSRFVCCLLYCSCKNVFELHNRLFSRSNMAG